MPDHEPITSAGLDALKAELAQLETTGRRDMAERINDARSLGDLKENADYHIAKEDQAHMETKISRLRERLRNAVVVEADESGTGFDFGRTAEVVDEESGKTHTWKLVGATEASVAEGKLSAESPVGAALLGAELGSVVAVQTPRGERRYRIETLLS